MRWVRSAREIAKRLAAARRITLTEAVRQALKRNLAGSEQDLQAREQRLEAALARLDALPRRRITVDYDLYDDMGNPVL
jgi:hypothetical protein